MLEIDMKKNNKLSKIIKSNTEIALPHATLKDAIQKRIVPSDHSSIIPGIDINELQHSLDLLKYALDYSEAIVDTVKLPLIVLNKKLEVLTANRAFYDTFKLTPQKTENKRIYKLHGNAWNIPKLKVLLEKILPANTHFDNYEVVINLPHLGERIILLNARRTYRQVNNTEAILLSFEDITHRKQLERQKDDFIGIVSHELRTPLTSMKAFSQLLEKHLLQNTDKKGTFYLSRMTNQMEKLTQLMASFVDVYKVQNGKLALHKKNFVLDELISAVVSDFQYTTTTHEIQFTGRSKTILYADKDRIAQVLINLISNAIKYSPTAEKIMVTSTHDKDKATISIQDFGFGIPETEQNKIFERFFRLNSKREGAISGLGLGLYLVYQIIQRHKGKIWVESSPKKGSTFHISLPLKH